jgi:hypothetical protein
MDLLAAIGISLFACGGDPVSIDAATSDAVTSLIDASETSIDGALGPDSGPVDTTASFFVTSIGNGPAAGNLGGLAGADEHCTALATMAGLGARTWAAYLSTATENARNRIGNGPWSNVHGDLIAANVVILHADGIPAALVINENGESIDLINAHDIVTGSGQDGWFTSSLPNCQDYTSNSPNDYTVVGHADGGGVGQGGISGTVAQSWNSAHITQCDQAGMQATAGRGHLYCFGR